MRLPALLFLCATGLAACAPFPELDALGPATGAPPELLPLEDLLAQADATSTDPAPSLQARAARLKARAAAIPDIPPPS